ncbi:MAG TPA: hypothetical protein VNK82_01400 [Terriglobales bacterium]|nr:hypothetical protein [Terriglobales bacterium]
MRTGLLSLALLALSVRVPAQYGTAPSGYYPTSYGGSIFTGKVVSGDANQNLTLTYTKGSKTETFVGRLVKGCNVPTTDGSKRLMNATDVSVGSLVTVFFQTVSRKENGKKVKENQIIAISFSEVDGKKIPEDKWLIYNCRGPGYEVFRF